MLQKTLGSIVIAGIALSAIAPQVSANISAANTLASQGVISVASDYRLSDTITRKEMMKIVMNLSGKNVPDTCNGTFSDVSNDWGCKYIEAALANGFIASNATFRPDDTITKAESIKLALGARGISKAVDTGDWQADWMNTAYDNGLLDAKYSDHNTQALRGWIFGLGANPITSRVASETVAEVVTPEVVTPTPKPEPTPEPEPIPEPTPEPEPIPEVVVPTGPVTLSSGNFSGVSASVSGTATFIQDGDSATIELTNFKSSSGPDLGIYLSKKDSISSSSDISGAIKLTKLTSSSGDQTYSVPADIDLSEYNSIAIHCTAFNKLFGSASLK